MSETNLFRLLALRLTTDEIASRMGVTPENFLRMMDSELYGGTGEEVEGVWVLTESGRWMFDVLAGK